MNQAGDAASEVVGVGQRGHHLRTGGVRPAAYGMRIQLCPLFPFFFIEPWRYLRAVLEQLPTQPPERLLDLLPDRWAAAQRTAVVAQAAPPPDSS